jgi:hypothetical protein
VCVCVLVCVFECVCSLPDLVLWLHFCVDISQLLIAVGGWQIHFLKSLFETRGTA